LDGKLALVTGGGSGIGAEIVRVLAEQGARVVVGDINEAQGQQRAQEVGGVFAPLDVSNPEAVAAAFETVDALGTLAVLVNCAGIGFVGNILSTSVADFDRLMGVNARGVFLCTQAAIPRMQRRGGGSIVNICSIAAKVALADRFAYSATKGAVLSMTQSVALDFIKENIRCNCICPARVYTPFVEAYLAKNYPGEEEQMRAKLAAAQPIGRMGTPREIAHLALYLASDEAAFVTGSAYDIDGGTLGTR
jgi:NAD(P)-dependent dehydrogenase (short-subunit alcohol dehydrogenase family)